MKRGIKTIIIGVVLFLLGMFVVPFLFVLPLLLGDSDTVQFKIPGTMETVIEQPGRYYLWNDFQTLYEGKIYNRSQSLPNGIQIQIWDSNGQLLPFVGDTSISTSNSSNSIGYVEIAHAGKVIIEVSGGNEQRIFSFSKMKLLKMFGLILGGACSSILVTIGGIGLIIWGIVKLVRANKKSDLRVVPMA